MADRLAGAAAGPVTRLVIEGANHHAAEMLEVGGGVIFAAAQRFLEASPNAAGSDVAASHACRVSPDRYGLARPVLCR
jgi:hypothetical protein